MSALNLRLPDSIHRHIREIAKREGVSINQFISTAVSEKVSAILTEEYLSDRASRAKKGTLKRILDNVPVRVPLPEDKLSQVDVS
jgi:uncharacterized protein (DUF1778 family)